MQTIQQRTTRAALLSSARGLASAVDNDIEKYVVFVATLANSLVVFDDLSSFLRVADNALTDLPGSWIVVFDPTGKEVLNTNPQTGDVLPPDNDLDLEHRAFASDRAQISDLVIGTVSKNPFITIAVPVFRDGKPLYLLSLRLQAQRLQSLIVAQHHPAGWYACIVDRKGIRIARVPGPDDAIGKPASESWHASIKQASEGVAEDVSFEGEPLMDAYTPTRHGWTVSVGMPKRVFDAPARETRWISLGGTSAVLFVSFVLGWFIARRFENGIDKIKAAAAAMSAEKQLASDFIGIREFDYLSGVFSNVSWKLLRRSSERERRAQHLGADLQVMNRLYRVAKVLGNEENGFEKKLLEVLDAAIEICGAEKGTLQTFDNATGALKIDAQRGFDAPFLDFFTEVKNDGCACGHVLNGGSRVVIEDVTQSEIFAGQPSLKVLLDAGVRAVQSTPVVSSIGRILGVISTHFANPHLPSDGQLRFLDLLARLLGDYLERRHAHDVQKTLSREVQHRSNNLLSIVQAIARNSLAENLSVDEASRVFEGRLHALARANMQLTNSKGGRVNLSEIIRTELEPFASRAVVNGNDIALGPQQAQNISLVLHELTTNAAKYGALSNDSGKVEISWRVVSHDATRALQFKWQERGGPPVKTPTRSGFGTTLVKAMFREVHLDYAPTGFGCELETSLIEPAIPPFQI